MYTVSLSVCTDAHWCTVLNMFGYIEVIPVYCCEHCGHCYTLAFGSVSCGSITELV